MVNSSKVRSGGYLNLTVRSLLPRGVFSSIISFSGPISVKSSTYMQMAKTRRSGLSKLMISSSGGGSLLGTMLLRSNDVGSKAKTKVLSLSFERLMISRL